VATRIFDLLRFARIPVRIRSRARDLWGQLNVAPTDRHTRSQTDRCPRDGAQLHKARKGTPARGREGPEKREKEREEGEGKREGGEERDGKRKGGERNTHAGYGRRTATART